MSDQTEEPIDGSKPEGVSDAGAYKVGRGRPPKETRFRPGRSGNPKGRPKGPRNFGTHLRDILAEPVMVTENGKRRRRPKGDVLLRQTVNKAFSGSDKALALILNEMRRQTEGGQSGPTLDVRRLSDPDLIASIVQRIRENGEAADGSQSLSQSRSDEEEL
jgi:hypothetical protein